MKKFTVFFNVAIAFLLSSGLLLAQESTVSKAELLSKIGIAPAMQVNKTVVKPPSNAPKGSTAWLQGLWTPDFGQCDADLPTTSWTSIAAPAAWQAYGGDFDNLSPNYYYVIDTPSGHLLMIDVTNGAIIKDIGAVDLSGYSFTGMACDRNTGIMYVYALDFNVDSYLFTLDVNTATVTLVGGLGLAGTENIIDMAIDGTGTMYAWGLDDNLYSVNTATGAGTLVGPIGIDINYAQGGSWDPVGDIIYAAAYNYTTSNPEMHSVNRLTGAFTFLEGLLEESDAMGFPNPTATPTVDLLVASVDAPVSGPLGAAEAVTITVYNIGTATESNIPVSFTIDGGTPVSEVFAGPLAPNSFASYTFTGTADCSVIGPHQIVACTGLSTDDVPSNDCVTYDFTTLPPGDCQHTIELYDTFGDSWNGGSLDVLVNGNVVLDDITVATGFGPAIFSFYVSTGDLVETVFTAGGWPEENYYEFYDDLGTYIAGSGPQAGGPPDINYNAVCAGCCDHAIVLEDTFGDGWNGGYVDVYVDGNPVLTGLTLLTGAGPETTPFYACNGADIDVYYTAGGWPEENTYSVLDGLGNIIGNAPAQTGGPGDLLDMIGNCTPATCPDPSNLFAIPGDISAVLKWAENGTATAWDIELGPAGFTPTGIPTHTGVTNPFNVTGLTETTDYDFWVRADCGGGTYSNWVGHYTFVTTCTPLAIPHSENFDLGGAIPPCWSTNNGNVWSMSINWPGSCPPTGYRWFSDYTPFETGTVFSPLFDGSSSTGLHVGFYHYWRADYSGGNQDGYFYGTPDGGITIYLLDEWHHNAPALEEGWKQYDISGWADGASHLEFWWEVSHDNDWYWTFDDFFIQSGPMTPGGMWTGAISNDWHNICNWMDKMIPDMNTDVVVQTGLPNYPTLNAPGECADIWLMSDGTNTATLVEQAPLTVYGTATAERYYASPEWHLISSPISNGQAGMYTGMYLQSYSEPANAWIDIIPVTDPLTPVQGYALWVDAPYTTAYVGNLNTGNQSMIISETGPDPYHWNLFGNPYPSSLNWNTVFPANPFIAGAVYYLDAATGNYLSYNGGMGGGSQFVPPMQGFFVSALSGSHGSPFILNNSMRVHTGNNMYYKSEFDNMLVISATGNGYTDNAYLRFDESATNTFDSHLDAYKLFTWSNDQLPQFYTVGGNKLSINVLPETTMVPAGFKAGVSGTYTISIADVYGMSEVILEDLFTGITTNLREGSYTFNYNAGDVEERFVLHFAPLAVPELAADGYNIYSYGKDVYVYVPENTKGDIVIYNTLGQVVAAQAITSFNKISLQTSASYIVKVLSNDQVVTTKVHIH